MSVRLISLVTTVIVLVLAPTPARGVTATGKPRVRAELVSAVQGVQAGTPVWVALRQRIAPGWHTYWKNPGDIGEPTTLQKDVAAKGPVWLTVISSAPGTQGYVTAAQANELTAQRQAAPTAGLFDPEGTVGKLYKATVTPHMYVIDTRGVLVYAGAIDDRPTTRRADVQDAQNYVRAALESVLTGQPVKTPLTRAYGCTIMYA